MTKSIKIALILLVSSASLNSYSQKLFQQKEIKNAETQTNLMLTEIDKADHNGGKLVSPRTIENNKLKLVAAKDWTSGFFPGELWYLFELTKKDKWRQEAIKFTNLIEAEKLNATTHDMGFKIYCSFGNAFRLTPSDNYKAVIIQSAKTLATRFNPKVGLIRSWDHHQEQWKYPVIIDNMMNLELLFEATKLSGDSTYYKIAVAHANNTMKNHFRPDFSSFHVVGYDAETGLVEKKNTHQGFSDASAWARGQGWALYGYTLCYRETKDPKYLKQAENVANFIFTNQNMPKDLVPYWDFNAPNIPNEPRDVSAATVMASALFELSTYSNQRKDYVSKANQILKSISEHYTSGLGTRNGFILDHSTGSKPQNSEVDVPLSYADYYYLEALVRANRLKNHQSVIQ